MTTHYHFVIESTREALSEGMKRLNGVYAQSFDRKHSRGGHLFGDRFWAGIIDEDADYLVNACRYVVENPVRAGLCDRWEDWPWTHVRADLLD